MVRSTKTGKITPQEAGQLFFDTVKKMNQQTQNLMLCIAANDDEKAIRNNTIRVKLTAQEILDQCD